MARFYVYQFGGGLIVDIQSNILDRFHTRVVVPLVAEEEAKRAAAKLNPVFLINGTRYVMMTEFVAAVSVGEIGPTVANLTSHADEIIAAMDFLFQGY